MAGRNRWTQLPVPETPEASRRNRWMLPSPEPPEASRRNPWMLPSPEPPKKVSSSMSMAQAIVSIVLEQLPPVQGLRMVMGVGKKLNRLRAKFEAIQAVLEDAERKQIQSYAVRYWLGGLTTVSYDMHDVLDEWNTAILKLQTERAHENALTTSKKKKNKVRFAFPSPYFRLRQVVSHRDIAIKLKRIVKTIDDIIKEMNGFDFRSLGSSQVQFERPRNWNTSVIDVSEIHGRYEEKKSILSELLSGEEERYFWYNDLSVISLLGMAGIGKTTLARLVFDDEQVVNHFETRIWVTVSKSFDEFRIAREILESFKQHATYLSNLSVLDNICEYVQKRRFLLVLDDVQNEDSSKWRPLYRALNNGYNGSRILVTTREKTVARVMWSDPIITIEELPEETCWLLFTRIAFAGRPYEECEELEEIGRELVFRCQGHPLAVKIIGSLLRFKKNRRNWLSILDPEMWRQLEGSDQPRYFPPLLFSYFDMPPVLRHCFSYCAIFPNYYLISKDKLIKLWMAQGYLGMEFENEPMEIIGEKYFDELAARCFFSEFEKDDDGCIIRCKMDNMLRDIAALLTINECSIMEVNDLEETRRINSENRFLHTTLMLSKGVTTFPDFICSAERLRSLLVHYGVTNRSSVSKILPKLFDQLTCLRALDMSGKFRYENLVIEIPREIGKLLHLRYLNLSFLKIEELPETLCELCNLQTLELNSCTNLKKLPQAMGKLINLRHLGNNETSSLSYMPKGIERLTCLQTLSEFVVSGAHHENEASSIECLRNLNNLRGSLTIKGLGNVTNVVEAVEAKLSNKKKLLSLYLNFDKDEEEEKANDQEQNKQVLEALQPPPELKILEIRDYSCKTVFPDWMTLLTNLKMLSLHDCINLEYLPPLGKLSSLESLSLCSMAGVKRVGNEFLGIDCDDIGTLSSSSSSPLVIFPKLKTLKFLNMDEWEEWELLHGIIIMPRLRSLSLVYCPMLKMLPDHLLQSGTLEELNINWCSNLKQQYIIDADVLFKISSISKIMIDFDYVKGHNNC